jgi:hypothetical protein
MMTFPAFDNMSARGPAAFIGFCLIAAIYLVTEHTMHVLGILPYLLLLVCPLMHLFMHHGHGHGEHQHDANDSPPHAGNESDHA